jgi:hypothetical protein
MEYGDEGRGMKWKCYQNILRSNKCDRKPNTGPIRVVWVVCFVRSVITNTVAIESTPVSPAVTRLGTPRIHQIQPLPIKHGGDKAPVHLLNKEPYHSQFAGGTEHRWRKQRHSREQGTVRKEIQNSSGEFNNYKPEEKSQQIKPRRTQSPALFLKKI